MKIDSPYTFRIELVIRWKELDALNHVNNAQYFSYFEEARIQYFNYLKLDTNTNDSNKNKGPILAHVACNFLNPVLYPDTLSIGSGVTRIGRSSLDLDHDIFSYQQNKIVATAHSVIVMLDYQTGKSIPIDDEMKLRIGTPIPGRKQ